MKMVFSRRESILVHPKRHNPVIRLKTGATKEGKLVAVQAEIYGDAGAYASLSEHGMTRSATHAAGPPGGESLWPMAWRRFRPNPAAIAGLAVLLLLSPLSLLAPHLAPDPRDATNLLAIEQPPSAAHWLGADDLGRDQLTRLLWGNRISLSVGLVAVGIAITIGTLLGGHGGVLRRDR